MNNLKNIKIAFFDLDGVLTDGIYQMSSEGITTKSFYSKDFYGLESLLKSGIRVVIITQSDGRVIKQQITRIMESRKIWREKYNDCSLDLFASIEDKKERIDKYLEHHDISWENIAYIGDAENDLASMKASGFTACPSDAIEEVKEECNLVSDSNGGKGAVYEICKYILENRRE